MVFPNIPTRHSCWDVHVAVRVLAVIKTFPLQCAGEVEAPPTALRIQSQAKETPALLRNDLQRETQLTQMSVHMQALSNMSQTES